MSWGANPERFVVSAADRCTSGIHYRQDELVHSWYRALPEIMSGANADLPSAPNVTGAVMLLILAFASDYSRLRFPFIALGSSGLMFAL